MVKTLTKHGNSPALVIEKPILDLLGVEADTPFNLIPAVEAEENANIFR